MAKTNNNPNTPAEKTKTKKKGKFDLKAFFQRIGRYFREVVSELKKVSWPSRKELTAYSIAVLVSVAVFGIITFVMDTGLSAVVNLLLK